MNRHDLDSVLEEFEQFASTLAAPPPPPRGDSKDVMSQKNQGNTIFDYKNPKEHRTGSAAVVKSLDTLLADMETFNNNNNNNNYTNNNTNKDKTQKIKIQVEEGEGLEEQLEQLTDQMVQAFQGKDTKDSGKQSSAEENSLGTCKKCGKRIAEKSVLVGKEAYHHTCFTCHHCKERLPDKFFIVNGNNYCEKHKQVALDKCQQCNKHLDAGSILVNTKKYHPECFVCSECLEPLSGKFFTTNDGRNLCEIDYKNSKEKCCHCGLPMLDKTLTAMDRKYHPTCFRCALCDIALDGVPFIQDGKAINCKECYARYKAKQCCVCSKGIVSSPERKTSLITCNGKSYHEQCYNCQGCGQNLCGEYCFTEGESIFCTSCETERKRNN